MSVVTQLPLPIGSLGAARPETELGSEEIRGLLRKGPIQFVVASVGDPLEWVPIGSCFSFWKAELQDRIAPVEGGFRLESFPGERCYRAVQWVGHEDAREILVVLEALH